MNTSNLTHGLVEMAPCPLGKGDVQVRWTDGPSAYIGLKLRQTCSGLLGRRFNGHVIALRNTRQLIHLALISSLCRSYSIDLLKCIYIDQNPRPWYMQGYVYTTPKRDTMLHIDIFLASLTVSNHSAHISALHRNECLCAQHLWQATYGTSDCLRE